MHCVLVCVFFLHLFFSEKMWDVVGVGGVTCLYLLAEDVSKHSVIDIMNQDKSAVV